MAVAQDEGDGGRVGFDVPINLRPDDQEKKRKGDVALPMAKYLPRVGRENGIKKDPSSKQYRIIFGQGGQPNAYAGEVKPMPNRRFVAVERDKEFEEEQQAEQQQNTMR